MTGKHPKEYSIDEVCLWVFALGLGDMADAFREAAIDGDMLLRLGDEDFKELGLSSLQGKKVMRGIEISASQAEEEGGGETILVDSRNSKLKTQRLELSWKSTQRWPLLRQHRLRLLPPNPLLPQRKTSMRLSKVQLVVLSRVSLSAQLPVQSLEMQRKEPRLVPRQVPLPEVCEV
jgi:hypothetical protein